jgi:peptide/nickel transport system substrate-binding protein
MLKALSLSMRSLVSAVLAVAALTFTPSVVVAAKDKIVIGMSVEPTGLDPTIAAPVAIGQVVWQNVFEGLVKIDRDGKVQPQLAQSWDISEDGRLYTFVLREGVQFHDGSAFDAQSAKFALDRARGAGSVNPQKRFFTGIESVDAQDAKTLVIKLNEPNANLLYHLGWPASVMVSASSADGNKVTPIGTGPYKFSNWSKGNSVELVRNDAYWDKDQLPEITTAIFRFVNDPQAQAAALKAGDIDAFPQFGAPELMATFEGDSRLAVHIGNTEMKVVAGLNNTRAPFNDKRVRQALMMAIDRQTVIDGAWSGFGTAIGSHFTPNTSAYVDTTAVMPYDVDRAKALLAEAGFADGLSITIKAPQMAYAQRSAQMLQAMLAEIGVTLTIETTEFPAKWVADVLTKADYEMTIVAHAEPMDIEIYANKPYYFNYENEEFRSLMREIAQTSDQQKRDELYGKAQQILAQDVPALFLFVMPKLGVWDKGLEGLWINEPIPSNVLRDVRWQN